jgi:hypothetical protein
MKEQIKIKERHKTILRYIHQFSQSIKFHSANYIDKIFVNPKNPPDHFIYICPLCTQNFILIEKSVGFVWTTEFTFDHFPPESVGGKHQMLVCKKCNSDAGSAYDFSLKEKLSRMSFENKIISSEIKATSQISNVPGNYKSAFFINDKNEMEIDFKPSDNMHVPFVDQWLENSKTNSDWEVKITIQNPDDARVSKAMVKASYLFCFANWGYDFVYSPAGEMIRKYLNGVNEYPVRVPVFWVGTSIRQNQISHFPIGLCYLQKPTSIKTFIVNMLLLNKETDFREVASVLIPNPTDDGWNDLKAIQASIEKSYDGTLSIELAHVNDFILSNKVYDGYQKSWEKLKAM